MFMRRISSPMLVSMLSAIRRCSGIMALIVAALAVSMTACMCAIMAAIVVSPACMPAIPGMEESIIMAVSEAGSGFRPHAASSSATPVISNARFNMVLSWSTWFASE
jgi:hypothetical protein